MTSRTVSTTRRVVELALAEEAEERVDDRRGCAALEHLRASLGVGLRLVAQRAAQHLGEDRDLLRRGERLGAGELELRPRAAGQRDGRDRRDVGRVDQRDRHVRPRGADDVVG